MAVVSVLGGAPCFLDPAGKQAPGVFRFGEEAYQVSPSELRPRRAAMMQDASRYTAINMPSMPQALIEAIIPMRSAQA